MYKEVNPLPKYHRQDISISCGWANAQILLNSINTKKADKVDRQATLQGELQLNNWFTEPQRLRDCINDKETIGETFTLFSCTSEEAISRRIVVTIFEMEVVPAALVWDERHWVVVYGCEVSKKPKIVNNHYDPEDRAYNIEAFWVCDPAPAKAVGGGTNELVNFTHSDTDRCGDGLDSATGTHWGSTSRRVDYLQWKQSWMVGVKRTDLQPPFRDRFIAVAMADATSTCPSWD